MLVQSIDRASDGTFTDALFGDPGSALDLPDLRGRGATGDFATGQWLGEPREPVPFSRQRQPGSGTPTVSYIRRREDGEADHPDEATAPSAEQATSGSQIYAEVYDLVTHGIPLEEALLRVVHSHPDLQAAPAEPWLTPADHPAGNQIYNNLVAFLNGLWSEYFYNFDDEGLQAINHWTEDRRLQYVRAREEFAAAYPIANAIGTPLAWLVPGLNWLRVGREGLHLLRQLGNSTIDGALGAAGDAEGNRFEAGLEGAGTALATGFVIRGQGRPETAIGEHGQTLAEGGLNAGVDAYLDWDAGPNHPGANTRPIERPGAWPAGYVLTRDRQQFPPATELFGGLANLDARHFEEIMAETGLGWEQLLKQLSRTWGVPWQDVLSGAVRATAPGPAASH